MLNFLQMLFNFQNYSRNFLPHPNLQMRRIKIMHFPKELADSLHVVSDSRT